MFGVFSLTSSVTWRSGLGPAAGPPSRVGSGGKNPSEGLVWISQAEGPGGQDQGRGCRRGRVPSQPFPCLCSRESLGHLDRQDLRGPEVSRAHQGPRAEPSRDPW